MDTGQRGGFTIVELLIVITIIAVLGILAIPNLIRSRTTANEATAITNLKAYSSAQVTFQLTKAGTLATNSKAGIAGFCDNFRNLHYGTPRTAPNQILALISKQFADAYARAPGSKCAPTYGLVSTPAPEPQLYQGYLFAEAKEMIDPAGPSNLFLTNYAFMGVPYTAGREGSHCYWIGLEGTVYAKGLVTGTGYATSIEVSTPFIPATASGWDGL
jgi:prepilin-type N-terminal cleavage/methylation domain-containing protein